jgi:hypothetical protein
MGLYLRSAVAALVAAGTGIVALSQQAVAAATARLSPMSPRPETRS